MKHRMSKWLALLTALILALGAAAYAMDFLGVRAMLMQDDKRPTDHSGGSYLSISQPQAVPDEMDAAVREKIDNSTKAWAEWESWRLENGPIEPESCKAPEHTSWSTVEENEDGTYTMIFYSRDEEEIERRIVSKEDYEQFEAYWEVMAKGFTGYDFNYHVYTQEMADKLESIAASYGLKLRHQNTVMFQNYDGNTSFFTREEITERINEICAGGESFFRTEPTGYDKFYYYDEGTFAVSFYTTDNMTNTGTSCYLYNSPYGTLSSGFAVFDRVEDVNGFTTRTHTAPDGTELTILQNGAEMYAYVYLENSFVAMHIHNIDALTDAEIDAILDMVNYSAIR